jgi:hypothetical protein
MKKSLFLLAILAAFAFGAVAQDASQSSSATGQTSTAKSKKKSSDSSMSGMDMSNDKGSAKKGSTLTGCVSSSANSEGMYTLTNGRYKKGVEIGPADKVKDHAGHQVALTGKWGTGAEAGEKAGTKEGKGERHFDVSDVKHISPTCSEAPGGGTMGTKGGKKGKTASDTAAPKGF